MSRVGKKIIDIPNGIDVKIVKGEVVVKKGNIELKTPLIKGLDVNIDGSKLTVIPKDDMDKALVSSYGLLRALLNNMITGIDKGFSKELEILGVGYRAKVEGSNLILNLGFSHPVTFPIPEGIKITVDGSKIKISGFDKELVGLTGAKIRDFKRPEPYKGKGIRYVGEYVRKKVGKAGSIGK